MSLSTPSGSAGNTNGFRDIYNRMTGGSGGGTSIFSEARRMQFEFGMAHLKHQLGEAAADSAMQRSMVINEQKHGFAKDMADHEWGIEERRLGVQHENAKDMASHSTKEQAKRERATARTEVWKATAIAKVPTDMMARLGMGGEGGLPSPTGTPKVTAPRYGGGSGVRASRKLRNKARG